MANILVTGATGFIGQHLVRSLLDDSHTIRAIKHGNQPICFFKENEVEWWQVDIRDPSQFKGICKNIDIVYHLAAISRNDLSKTWDEFVAINITGTENLLKEAETSKVKRFVFTSTVEAAGYGDGTNPRKEEDIPNPENNYGKSKLETEKIVLSSKWKTKCVILRLPMIYGPGTFLIVPKLFGLVRRGFYPLIGSGKTLMEFCYIENAIQAIKLAGEKKKAVNQLFYVSDERSYPVKEVITAIAKAMQKKVVFLHIPVFFANTIGLLWEIIAKIIPFSPIISPISRKPFFTRETVMWTTRNVNIVSTEKITSMLGFKPSVSIDKGCDITAKWLNEQLWTK